MWDLFSKVVYPSSGCPLTAAFALAGSHDPEPTPLRLLLQLPTEEPARVQAGGTPLPQNGV